jgi:hypothetical protein
VCTLECNVALHVDTITFGNGTCEISPESTEDVPEDRMNVTKELIEAPNQSSEDVDISDFSPTRRQAPDISHYFIYTAIYVYYIVSCIKSRSCNETLDA